MEDMKSVQWLVARAAWPGIVSLSLVFAWGLLERGASPGATATFAFLFALATTMAVERFGHGRAIDLAYLGLAALGQTMIKLLLGLALAPRAARSGLEWAVLALLLADLGKYWIHRLAHERAWLFRFHAEHHAPSEMYALNGVRMHPVNLAWNVALDVGVPMLLGLDGRALVMVAVFRGAVSVLQHANAPLVLGPLNWMFSTPDLHRFHHSKVLREANSNYGSTLIVWDVLFGTRRCPLGTPAALGLSEDAPHPRRIARQLVWPWCRAPERCLD